MNTNNTYSPFEKMLKEKLGQVEYPYEHSDWLGLEKDLPKINPNTGFLKNFFKFFGIPAAVIIPAFLILYFTDVIDFSDNKNTTDLSKNSISQNQKEANENSLVNADENSSEFTQNPNETVNNDATMMLSATNNEAEKNSDDKVEKNDESKTSNAVEKENQTNTKNNQSQQNETKTVSGVLISSDITEGCAPLKVKFSPFISLENITYLWDFGDGKTSSKPSPTHTYLKAGNYTVTLTVKLPDNKIKKVEYNNKISVKDVPVADFTYSKNTENDEYIFTDNSKNAFNWAWSFGDKSTSIEKTAQHTYVINGTYNVKLIVTNTSGCSDTIIKNIDVKLRELYYCPNGFTPNGDGLNDYFGPVGERMNPDGYSMQIFNQNGLLVFETNDLNIQWDGKNSKSNTEAAQGLYYWKISMKDTNNITKETSGSVLLMK